MYLKSQPITFKTPSYINTTTKNSRQLDKKSMLIWRESRLSYLADDSFTDNLLRIFGSDCDRYAAVTTAYLDPKW